MADNQKHDVFLSHSSKDNDVVREIANRLRGDGIRVWFDEWEIQAGDSIPAKINEGLENSRVLVLCMSSNAFGSEWAHLESYTFRFRDPRNKDRRFIPVRLDETPVKGSLGQFLYVNWLPQVREQEYPKLLAACRPPAEPTAAEVQAECARFEQKVISLGHTRGINSVAFSPDGLLALSGSDDQTVRLWDVESGCCLRVFEGRFGRVDSLAWSPDGQQALSGSFDKTARLWDVADGRCLRLLEGHTEAVYSVALSGDGQHALSGSEDKTVRLWDVADGRCLHVLEGHTASVYSVAWSGDRLRALSAAENGVMRVWNIAELISGDSQPTRHSEQVTPATELH